MSSDASLQSESRRTLGAIVFTDVANFTRRVAQDETLTLGLVKRDLEMMGRYCGKFDGRVIKNTGDGLLMYFSSAVQAVSCAVKVQKILSDSAKKLPVGQVLKHRIGIHLGDVFLSETDVLGDGVNIAARLQQQAEPGGICFSQTVYDVVKNRFGLKTTYVGPTELKNIQEKIPVYKVITDATDPVTSGTAKPLDGDGLPPRTGSGRQRWVAVAGGCVLVFAGLGIGMALMLGRAKGDTSTSPVSVVPPAGRSTGVNPPRADGADRSLPDPRPTGFADHRGRAAMILRDRDRNGDGSLQYDELPPHRAEEMLRRADTDRDGLISLAEIQASGQILDLRRRRGEGPPPKRRHEPEFEGGFPPDPRQR